MKRLNYHYQLLVFIISLGLATTSYAQLPTPHWATAIVTPQLANFHQVSPNVYRSSQPYTEGYSVLKTHHIGEILDLRLYHRDAPPAAADFTLHHVPMLASQLNEAEMIHALNVIAQAKQPILVHCYHGSDRTGAVIALYRIVCQQWSKTDALAELEQGDFGYHPIFSNIPRFIQNIDIPTLKKKVQGNNCPALP